MDPVNPENGYAVPARSLVQTVEIQILSWSNSTTLCEKGQEGRERRSYVAGLQSAFVDNSEEVNMAVYTRVCVPSGNLGEAIRAGLCWCFIHFYCT